MADISRAMVHDFAMGTSITSRMVSAEGGAVSDRTRQLRDEEQQHLADDAMRVAVRLVTRHRAQLDELARCLLRHEVLERPTSTGSCRACRASGARRAAGSASRPRSAQACRADDGRGARAAGA